MAIPTNSDSLSVNIENNLATIEFEHPASNSFPSVLLQKLAQTIQTVGENPEVVVIVLRSKGLGAFCAGASFDELVQISHEVQGHIFFSGFAQLINTMRKCPKLIIGRIHGKAVGGGVGIAAACDYVLASQQASIKLSEIAIGIGPFVIEPALSRKMGKTAMAELALAPQEWKSAEWAQQKGLYAHIFETLEELDQALTTFGTNLAKFNPEALSEMKKILWEGTDHWDTLLADRATISGKLVLSEFTKKALKAFQK